MCMKRVTYPISQRCMAGRFGMVAKSGRFGRMFFLKPSLSWHSISFSFLAHPLQHPGLLRLGLVNEGDVLGIFFNVDL